MNFEWVCAPGAPNLILEGDGFYISYNDTDTEVYGDVTTSLVIGNMERFYILRGDHRTQFRECAALGPDACLNYYRANYVAHGHQFSDPLPEFSHQRGAVNAPISR
ncbi:hypothetical protein [Ralstonia phage phiRSL1]|uniref:Uncharacterized protein n=1 Tax=Ralstonia phage phiRSL1 TaxID=1980924 RepID=B2ZYH3_9CAUD|nr:hypothetical protein RSL1_ORF252 [Ralstonia phage phiRSL1]BAG41700.1 hypothetical protein [Ralstonia phage phiRSL1]